MKLFVVSGVSGSGKSTALNVFEDLDFYCIDNLPAGLLPAFAERMSANSSSCPIGTAVGIDARNVPDDIANFPRILATLINSGVTCEVLFLSANDEVLIKRFSETRRKHPLSDADVPLAEAIQRERVLLQPIQSCADLYIDTSQLNIHQLRDAIKQRVVNKPHAGMSLLFESFGFKRGVPTDVDFVFDVRCLPNPHWIPALREKTGLDTDVAAFLETDPEVNRMFDHIRQFLEHWLPRFEADNRSYMTVAIGCTGGQHRSVYFAQRLAQHFARLRNGVLARHRDLA
jgi:UPF0042 nucleotide-binding protein